MTRIILYGQKSLHIDGYKQILSMEAQCIRIQCKNKILNISGKNLYISSFSNIEMTIKGDIDTINWLNK